MDGRQFDRWSRTLAAGIDRRTTLKVLAAGIAGAALAASGRGEAAAGATVVGGTLPPAPECALCCVENSPPRQRGACIRGCVR